MAEPVRGGEDGRGLIRSGVEMTEVDESRSLGRIEILRVFLMEIVAVEELTSPDATGS